MIRGGLVVTPALLILFAPERLLMSTPTEPTPSPGRLTLKVISHTGLIYFWPVWLAGFILAGLTYAEDTRLAVVPAGTAGEEVQPRTGYPLTAPKPPPASPVNPAAA